MKYRIEKECIIVGYNESIVEHKDDNREVLYTEIIKEPQYEIREIEVQLTDEEERFDKINTLKQWFDTTYRCQIEQATRAQFFNETFSHNDHIRGKIYAPLNDLYCEGRLVQQEIRNLEDNLNK